MLASIFSCAFLVIYISSLGKCPFNCFAIFKFNYLSFYCWIVRVLHIFWIQVPYQMHDLKIFYLILYVVLSLSWWCPFKSVTNVNFDEVQFIYLKHFLSCHLCFLVLYLRNYCLIQGQGDLHFLLRVFIISALMFLVLWPIFN
jgi:hypothetical protein